MHARIPKCWPAVAIIKILHRIILSLTHIHTNCDTHGFWACRHPSPPLHSPGQYPQPGWSSLNSPVFTRRKRGSRGYNNVPHPWYFWWFNAGCSSAPWPWGLLPVAASLGVSGSRHAPSPSLSPWKTLCRRWSRRWRETARESGEKEPGKQIWKSWQGKSRDNAVRECRRLKKRLEQHGGRTCWREKRKVKVRKKRALSRTKGC